MKHKNAPRRTLAVIGTMAAFLVLLAGCGRHDDYTPKPRAYLRIDLPPKDYKTFDTTALPFAFEQAAGSEIVWKKNTVTDKWIDINYPSLKGVVFLCYKSINGVEDLRTQIDTSYQLLSLHFKIAGGIEEQQFTSTDGTVSATTYHIKGSNAASTYQFWATDSVRHFLRGALYFDLRPNNDSLAPVVEYLQHDIDHLIETLRWK